MVTKKRGRRADRRVSARKWADNQSMFTNTSLNVPEGLSVIRIDDEKARRFDIMSYRAGKGNPNADAGDAHMERTFFVHRLGPDNRRYVCPKETVGRPCPVCEERARLRRDPESDEAVWKAMFPSRRQLWLVKDLDHPEDGVRLMDYSYHQFGKQLKFEIDNADEDDEFEFFADLGDGFTLKIAFIENKPYGFEAKSINFRKRKESYDESLLDELPCLDDLLKVESYDKLKAILFQTEDEDQDDSEDDDEPASTAEDAGIKVGSKVGHDELGRCTVKRISGDGTSLTLEDEDGEVYRPIGMDEVNLIEEKPEKKHSTRKRKPAREEPEPEEDEDEPEEKPAPKKKTTKKKTPKPEPEGDDWPDDDDDDWPEDGPASEKKTTEKKPAKPTPDPEPEEDDDDWPDDDED